MRDLHRPLVGAVDREPATTWATLAVLGAIAWVVTVAMARDMGVGPGTMGTTFLVFLAAWVAMMGAMMLPAMGPSAVRVLPRGASTAAARLAGTVPFALGFLAPWAVFGAAFFVALAGAGHLVGSQPDAAAWLGVGLVAVAGGYQLSPLKRRALDHCRAAAGGTRFTAGASEGARCVGCCWALMGVLIAFGAMNVVAMAALAAVIFGEKVLADPRPVTWAAGVVLLAVAVAGAVHHPLFSGLTPMESMTMMAG